MKASYQRSAKSHHLLLGRRSADPPATITFPRDIGSISLEPWMRIDPCCYLWHGQRDMLVPREVIGHDAQLGRKGQRHLS